MMQTSSSSRPTRAAPLSTARPGLQALWSGRRWIALLLALAALLGGVDAGAVPVTWNVNATTVSGITLTGSFVYDAATSTTSNVNLTASNGRSFTAYLTSSNFYSPAYLVVHESPVVAGSSWQAILATNLTTSPYTVLPRTDRGGTLTLDLRVEGGFRVCRDAGCLSFGPANLTIGDLQWASGTMVSATNYPFVDAVIPGLVNAQLGGTVTITGINFIGATDVKFGSVSVGAGNFTVVNNTTITARAPAQAAGSVKVTVTNAAGTTPASSVASSPDFWYYRPVASDLRILTNASTTSSITNATATNVGVAVKGIYLYSAGAFPTYTEVTTPPNNSTYRWALSTSSTLPGVSNANGSNATGSTVGGYTQTGRPARITNLNAISYTPVAADTGKYLYYCVTPAAREGILGLEVCSAGIPVGPSPGVCGSAANVVSATAPTTNLCTATGAAPTVTGSNGAWRWTCTGVNTGADASCTAPFPSQTITNFRANPTSIQVGATSSLSATKGAGSAALVFSSKTPAICTVAGSTVTAVAVGTCTVAANQAADNAYGAAAEVTTNITVQGLKTQAITNLVVTVGGSPTGGLTIGQAGRLEANKGAGTAAVVFSSKTPAVCTVSGNTVTPVTVGTCTVAANQAADAEYSAAPEVTLNLTVGKGSQNITGFAANPASIVVGGTSTLSATKGSGSAAVVFSSKTVAVCTVSGSTVAAVTAGTCTVAANQAADDFYNAATEVTTTITVGKASQTITNFSANPTSITIGGTSALSATKGAGSAAVAFSSKTPAICTVAGSTVTAVTVGTCTVAANQAADETYAAATEVTTNVAIGKASQTITNFSANPASITIGGTSTLSATKGAGSTAIVFSSKTPAVCTVAGSTVTAVTVGTCTVAANQAADDSYAAATEVTTNVAVGKASQTITNFAANPASINIGGTSTLSATKGAGSAAVAFSSKTPAICTVAGSTVTGIAEGSCTVAANQAEDAAYAAASEVTARVTIGKAAQTITNFAANPASLVFGGSSTLSATKGAGSAALVFSSKTPAVCTVAGSTVTAAAVGTCTVAANQAADESHAAAAEVTLALTVDKATQAITALEAAPAKIAVGDTTTLSATKGAGSAAVVFSSKTAAVCTVADKTVTALTAGTCTVAANQAGDANHNAAPEVTQSITVDKANQSLRNFGTSSSSISVGQTATLTVTKGPGSAAVAFSSKTEAVCTVTGSTVTAVAAGTCTVAANQAGDANYTAAPEVTTTLTITVAKVDGQCGSANGLSSLAKPAANLCTRGTASSVLTATTWNWTCQGSGGGSTASCAAPLAPAGSSNARLDAPTNQSGPVAWRVVEAATATVLPAAAPPEVTFPLGVVAMVLDTGTPGSSTQVTITYGQDIPAGARYWKYGRRATDRTAQWYVYPNAVISGRTVTLTLTDGGLGDSDLAVNGRIVDPGGIGIGGNDDKPQQIPTLSEWALIALAGLMMLAMMGHARQQRARRDR